ncbi:quinoprotein relay system zinc metallohydrolase 2 [Roseibium sp.]|uniref:quinoprotein relay system zinc metallohydrolase 2 n=1 Tax=Roseibium sp. TaxID=1936156 RepID=UPI003A9714C7
MFEIVVTACLMAQPEICRDLLASDRVFRSQDSCTQAAALSQADGPVLPQGVVITKTRRCEKQGHALYLTEIQPGLFVHQGVVAEAGPDNLGGIANLGVIIGERSIAVIDTGGSRAAGEALLRAVRRLSDLPVSHVFLTHMHPDHVLGASVFVEAGAEIVAHPSLRRALLDRTGSYIEGYGRLIGDNAFLGTRVVVPDEGEPPSAIDLGGRRLETFIWPSAHSPTDMGVLDEKTGTLFAGDIIFDRHVPVLDGSLKGWLAVLSGLDIDMPRRIVPGHGRISFGTANEATAPVRSYLQALEQDTRSAIATGKRLSEAIRTIGQSEAGSWERFEAFNARNATAAFTELEWE